ARPRTRTSLVSVARTRVGRRASNTNATRDSASRRRVVAARAARVNRKAEIRGVGKAAPAARGAPGAGPLVPGVGSAGAAAPVSVAASVVVVAVPAPPPPDATGEAPLASAPGAA